MSQLRVDEITNEAGDGPPDFVFGAGGITTSPIPSTAEVLETSGTFVVPDGVTRIKVTCVGGGGGGGATDGNESTGATRSGANGQAGGTVIQFLEVTPGDSHNLTVGAGGAGGQTRRANGVDGGDTVFEVPGGTDVVANGGRKGQGRLSTVTPRKYPAGSGGWFLVPGKIGSIGGFYENNESLFRSSRLEARANPSNGEAMTPPAYGVGGEGGTGTGRDFRAGGPGMHGVIILEY